MTKALKSKNLRRISAMLLAVIVLLGSMFTLPVSAASTVNITFDYCYNSSGNIIRFAKETTNDGYLVGAKGEELCRIYANGKDAYCIQPGHTLHAGDSLTEDTSTAWKNLGSAKQKAINLALLYGKSGSGSSLSGTEGQKWIATQLIVWEFVTGCRSTSAGFKCTNTKFIDGICSGSSNPGVQSIYNKIENHLAEHTTVPSFCSVLTSKAETYEMKYKDGEYTVTLTDTNKVLSGFNFKKTDGVSVSVSGNKLTLTSSKPLTDEVTFSSAKTMPSVGNSTLIPYGSASLQDVISGVDGKPDPVNAYFKVKTNAGSLKIVKTSEDGVVANLTFTIKGTEYEKTVKTNASGEFQVDDLVPDTYTVTESTPNKYAEQKSQKVTVEAGKTAKVTFKNVLKKWNVTVTKKDSETTATQGDSSLAGAEYGVYQGDKLIDKYTTDKKGCFTTSYYTCGDNWTLKEIKPGEGYLLDETVHHIGAEAKNYTVEKNSISMDVTEKVVKGNISIIKHTDDGSTKIEIPEKGAEFQVFLKSSGSYGKAKESERDLLVCDEYGFAKTKDLPYGTYTVHQIKGWAGTEYIADFDVFVNENGNTYRYLINNAGYKSYLKIVKTDSETGKNIAYSGAGFEIYNSNGKKISMKYTYPSVTKTDVFYTNSEGYLITPEALPYGKGYYVVEVQAPYGYILDSTPVYFDVTPETGSTEDEITLVKAVKKNAPQKGTITIDKKGEIFSTVTSSGESEIVYQPKYTTGSLANAVFEIYADEDITTQDGTVRYKKDTLADTVTTDENGTAKSKELYLGKYRVVEKTAPYGYVVSGDSHTVEITYAGQEIKVTNVSAEINNERQKAQISLSKILEQNEKFNIGNNGEILNVTFGLYANADIVAADGTMIPKDGLIEIIGCDENGKATFKTDLPFGSYYVKEYSTDNHYLVDETKYEFNFEYTDSENAVQYISVNNGESIENNLMYGTVTTTKVDEEYPENKLTGAVFEVYIDTDCNGKFDKDIDIIASELTEKETGVYTLSDLPYGNYLLYEKTAPTGFVKDNEYYHFEIRNDKETVTVENNAGVGFTNKPITGQLEITKKDVSDGKLLPYAGFRIKDEKGKTVVEGYTDKKGIARFTLRYGKYTYEEFEAPDGYIIDKKPHSFEIKKDGQIVKATMTNKAKKPEVPQTGDNSNYGFLIGLGAIAIGGIVAVLFIKLKKKDEDDD